MPKKEVNPKNHIMKTQAKITNEQEPIIEVEVIADAVIKISEAVERLKKSKLSERAILLLIHDNCSLAGGKFHKKPVTLKQVKAVYDSIHTLKNAYIKNK